MKDERYKNHRTKVDHQAWKIMPQSWIRRKEVGWKKMKDKNVEEVERKWKKEREFFLRKRMPQKQSTV